MKRLIDYTQGQSTLYSVALTGRLNFDINTATEWLTVLMLDAAADAINKKTTICSEKRQTLDDE